jgi:hypothetical protein
VSEVLRSLSRALHKTTDAFFKNEGLKLSHLVSKGFETIAFGASLPMVRAN